MHAMPQAPVPAKIVTVNENTKITIRCALGYGLNWHSMLTNNRKFRNPIDQHANDEITRCVQKLQAKLLQ